MAKIEDEAGARRLARAIGSDYYLYHAEAVEAGTDLSSEVAEGRKLFEDRTPAPLHHLYAEELAAMVATQRRPLRYRPEAAAPSSTAPAAAEPERRPAARPAPGEQFKSFYQGDEAERLGSSAPQGADARAGTGGGRILVFLLAALVVGVVAYFALGR